MPPCRQRRLTTPRKHRDVRHWLRARRARVRGCG
jgi:hypothetical protein